METGRPAAADGDPASGVPALPPAAGRRGARHRAGGRAPSRKALAGAALALAVALLVGGGVLALVRPGSASHAAAPAAPAAPPATGTRKAGPPSAPPSGGATAAGAELARWAGTELVPGDRLVAGPGAAAALRRARVPAGVVGAGSASGSALTVTDGTVPAGSRLVARFGDPPVLAVVDPAPVAPTADELQRRRDLAAALLANPTDRIAAPAAAVLRSAAIDPRLLALLATLTARSGIGIAALPAAPDEPPDVPLARSALIAEVGGHPVTAGSPGVPDLVAFLRAQLPPYAPAEVTVTASGVLVGYRYLSAPDATVTAASY